MSSLQAIFFDRKLPKIKFKIDLARYLYLENCLTSGLFISTIISKSNFPCFTFFPVSLNCPFLKPLSPESDSDEFFESKFWILKFLKKINQGREPDLDWAKKIVVS